MLTGHQVIQSMACIVASTLQKFNVDSDLAIAVGDEIATSLADKFGGSVLYVDKNFLRSLGYIYSKEVPNLVSSCEKSRIRFVRCFVDCSHAPISRLGIIENDYKIILELIFKEIKKEFKAINLYFPMGMESKKALIKNKVINGFNGTNHDQLAAENNISVRSVYRYLKGQRH